MDYDGNIYTTVIIGTREWMIENYRCTHYNDGTPIPNLTVNGDWVSDAAGAYCWFNNDIANKPTYGALYNYFSAHNALLPPVGLGFRCANQADWADLITRCGGAAVTGKIKETGTTHWMTPNTGANNEFGFMLLPGGYRQITTGSFNMFTKEGHFWSSYYSPTRGYRFVGFYNSASITNDINGFNNYGLSVRLVRDV